MGSATQGYGHVKSVRGVSVTRRRRRVFYYVCFYDHEQKSILLYFGLVAFRLHFGENPKTLIFMVFGFWDVSVTPKN